MAAEAPQPADIDSSCAAVLEGAIEQPLTFGLQYGGQTDDVAAAGLSPTLLPQPPQPPADLLLDCRRLWMPRLSMVPAAPTVRQQHPQQQQQPQVTEDAYREWLTRRYYRRFQPYAHLGGMPNRVLLDSFAGRDLRRGAKLRRLLRHAEADREGRTPWAEFYACMTYRKRAEVPTAHRLLNCLVKAADPGAAEAERRLRAESDRSGEPLPADAYLEYYSCRSPPVCLPLLLLSMWIAFGVCAVQLSAEPGWNRVGWASGLPYACQLAFCTARRYEVWRFASYALLHMGWHHLLYSSCVLLLIGLPLHLAHGALRVSTIFLGGVLLGSLHSSVFEPGAVLVGAGGGASALIGAHFCLALINWRQLRDEWLAIMGPDVKIGTRARARHLLSSRMLRIAALFALAYSDFALAVFQRHGAGGGAWAARPSYAAYPAGFLWGALVGARLIRRRYDDGEGEGEGEGEGAGGNGDGDGDGGRQSRRCCRGACLHHAIILGFSLYVAFAVGWNLLYSGYPNNQACADGKLQGLG